MTRPMTALIAVVLAGAISTAAAANKLERRMESATEVLQKFTQIPEQGIPPTLLNNAYAVAVIPGQIKAGFLIGGSFGQGILVRRLGDGRWSNPSFITLGAGSFGFQAGAQSTDTILVFKTRRGVERIHKGKLVLGGDIAIAAGPVGRYSAASTDLMLKAEILSYSRSRGLFGGVSLEGGVLAMDAKANYAYYGSGESTPRNLLSDSGIPTPASARRFQEVLANAAPSLEWQAQSRTAEISVPAPGDGAKTFAIDEAPEPESDNLF